jgi:hypothetical protein
MKVGKLSPS